VKIDVEYLETMHLRDLLANARGKEKKPELMKLDIGNDIDNEDSNYSTTSVPKKKQRTTKNLKTTDYVEVYKEYEKGDLALLSRRIRCYCGQQSLNDSKKEKNVEEELSQCVHCGLYSHTKCILQFYKYLNQNIGSIKIEGDLSSTCHLCYDIDTFDINDKADDKDDGPSFKDILYSMKKKRKGKVEYKVGEEVIIQSTTGIDVKYKIVSVEDGLSRIHQKGRPKEEDLWMYLDETICKKVKSDPNSATKDSPSIPTNSSHLASAPNSSLPSTQIAVNYVSVPPTPPPQLYPTQSNIHFARRVTYQQLKDCIYYFILHEINPRLANMKKVRLKVQQFFNMSRLERESYNGDIIKVIEEFRYDYDQVTKTMNTIIHHMIIHNDNTDQGNK
jgi:hypothetical protein